MPLTLGVPREATPGETRVASGDGRLRAFCSCVLLPIPESTDDTFVGVPPAPLPAHVLPELPAASREVRQVHAAGAHDGVAADPGVVQHHGLDADDEGRDEPEREALQQDEGHGGEGLAAEEHRGDEGLADEAAHRLDLVLHHAGDFRRLGPPELAHGKAQHPVDQLEAQASQHAFAEPPLVQVDVELEEAVDDHERQEGEA